MILNFGDRATERFFNEGIAPARWRNIASVAARKLDMVDAAERLTDLASPPGNRLHALRGDRAGEHAIRINDRWRVTFRWTDVGPAEVKVEDYHKGLAAMRIRTHPGEILNEEFLKPHALSQSQLAQALGVPQNRLSEIIRARRGISADTAIRLSRFFGTTPQFWLNLQNAHDLSLAESQIDYSSVKSYLA